jgi:hypothetical protein
VSDINMEELEDIDMEEVEDIPPSSREALASKNTWQLEGNPL